MKTKKGSPVNETTPKKDTSNNSSAELQRKRVLEALRSAGSEGLTTIQLREDYDIMAPAPRIYELRWGEGYNIQLIWDRDENAQGHSHSCGRYILLSGTWKGAA